MYLLIDRNRMCFCYRHPVMAVVFNLAHIELSDGPAVVLSEEDSAITGWGNFSDLELKLLYRNTTDLPPDMNLPRATLERAISDAVQKLEITDVDPVEAEAQAGTISDRDTDSYRYVKGAKKPRIQPDEAQLPILKAGSVVKLPKEEPAPTRPVTRPAGTGGVKQHLRSMFAEVAQHTLAALTADGRFSVSSIKTALSDLKNEKYAGGELLLTARVKIDGVDHYVKE